MEEIKFCPMCLADDVFHPEKEKNRRLLDERVAAIRRRYGIPEIVLRQISTEIMSHAAQVTGEAGKALQESANQTRKELQ